MRFFLLLQMTILMLAAPVLAQKDAIAIENPKLTADEKIEERLNGIFEQIDELQELEVSSNSGVVTLSGSAPTSEASEEALGLARKTEGVIYVLDRMEENLEVGSRLQPAINKARELGTTTIRKLPLIGIAILIVALAWFIGTGLKKRRRVFRRFGMNELAGDLLGRALRLLVLGIGIFIALEILDATAIVAAILGIAGVAGIALGFAFRNIVENYLAGILLSLRNPFSTGDAVEIQGFQGKVMRLTSRDTVLMTFDGNHLRLPNSLIMTSPLTNFSRNPLRRFDFTIGVSAELDLARVRQLGLDTLDGLKSVLDDPAPSVVIDNLGDSSVNMRFFGWIDQRKSDFMKTKSEAIRIVKDTFDDNDIEMSEPIYRVVMHQAKEGESRQVPDNEPRYELDTSPDLSLDRQVAQACAADRESNLLEEEETKD